MADYFNSYGNSLAKQVELNTIALFKANGGLTKKVIFSYSGNWLPSREYLALDLVFNSKPENGKIGLYFCKHPTNKGDKPSDSDYWQPLFDTTDQPFPGTGNMYFKGDFGYSTTYKKDDVVNWNNEKYTNKSGLYIYINETPSSGKTPDAERQYWRSIITPLSSELHFKGEWNENTQYIKWDYVLNTKPENGKIGLYFYFRDTPTTGTKPSSKPYWKPMFDPEPQQYWKWHLISQNPDGGTTLTWTPTVGKEYKLVLNYLNSKSNVESQIVYFTWSEWTNTERQRFLHFYPYFDGQNKTVCRVGDIKGNMSIYCEGDAPYGNLVKLYVKKRWDE